MPTLDDIINSVSNEYDSESNRLLIDKNLREIYIPPSITNIGVESDDDVLRLSFTMPRYYCGIDLNDFNVSVNYLNANAEGDRYEVEDKQADDSSINFSWLVGRTATKYKGTTKFNVCLRLYDTENLSEVVKEFNTTISELPVLEGLETSEYVVQNYSDILEQWKRTLETTPGPKGDPGEPGSNGITPHIGNNGHWYLGDNDTGVKAAGSDGHTPVITTSKTNGVTTVYVDGVAIGTVNDGQNGSPGQNGTTPHIGANNNWWIGDTDTGVKAAGSDGHNGVTPSIDNNGYWVIGSTTTNIKAAGADGHTPVVTTSKSNGVTTVYVDGVAAATINDGVDGQDGITPAVSVTDITGGHNVAFSYGSDDPRNADFNVMDGAGGSTESLGKLIGEVTMDNDETRLIEFTQCADGSPLDFDEIIYFINGSATMQIWICFTVNDEYGCTNRTDWTCLGTILYPNQTRYIKEHWKIIGAWQLLSSLSATSQTGTSSDGYDNIGLSGTKITSKLTLGLPGGCFTTGTKIKVYGR